MIKIQFSLKQTGQVNCNNLNKNPIQGLSVSIRNANQRYNQALKGVKLYFRGIKAALS